MCIQSLTLCVHVKPNLNKTFITWCQKHLNSLFSIFFNLHNSIPMYLEMTPGIFSCPCLWNTVFELMINSQFLLLIMLFNFISYTLSSDFAMKYTMPYMYYKHVLHTFVVFLCILDMYNILCSLYTCKYLSKIHVMP